MPGWVVFKLAIMVVATAAIVLVSRASLRDPRSHGFYRFFAWEAILMLILLNIDHWFDNPLRPKYSGRIGWAGQDGRGRRGRNGVPDSKT